MASTGIVQTCSYMNTHTHKHARANLRVVSVQTVHKAVGLNEINKGMGFREEIQEWTLGHSKRKIRKLSTWRHSVDLGEEGEGQVIFSEMAGLACHFHV